MATNSLIKFAVLTADQSPDYDTLTDSELVSLVGTTGDDGIVYGSVAKTDILNGLFRQLTYTNKVLGDLVAEHSGQNVNTSVADSTYQANMETAIGVVAKDAVNADLDTVLGISSLGFVKRTGVDTLGIVSGIAYSDLPDVASGRFLGRVAANTGDVTSLTRDQVIIGSDQSTTAGLVARASNGSYSIDTGDYTTSDEVALKESNSPIDPVLWVGSQAQYDALTPSDDVIYFIV